MSSTTKQGISLNQTMSLLSQYLVLVYTTVLKQWIAFSHVLIGCSNMGYPVLFTFERRRTRISYEQNGFPVCCYNKQRNFTNNNKKMFPKNMKNETEFDLEVFFIGKALAV